MNSTLLPGLEGRVLLAVLWLLPGLEIELAVEPLLLLRELKDAEVEAPPDVPLCDTTEPPVLQVAPLELTDEVAVTEAVFFLVDLGLTMRTLRIQTNKQRVSAPLVEFEKALPKAISTTC